MAIRTMICISIGEPTAIKIAQFYWAGDMDGAWDHSVKEIGNHFGLSSAEISKVVHQSSPLFILDVRCPTCGDPYVANSRTDFLQILRRPPNSCFECLDIKREEEELRLAESRRILEERQRAIWVETTNLQNSFDYYALDYLDACYAFVVLINSEFDEATGEIDLVDSHLFSADSGELPRVVDRLHKLGMLLFGKKTKLEAFLPGDNEDSYRYYPARISWRFAPPTHGDFPRQIFMELCEIIDNRDQDVDYSQAVSSLWWHIGEAETLRHLKQEFDVYRLAIPEGDKLTQAVRYALAHFSIPCVRNLIWRLAKNTAAYTARRDVHTIQAKNSVPGSLIRMCDRALADGWDIKPYVLKWDEEESLITTALFDRFIGNGVTGFKSTTGKMIEAMFTAKAGH
jgi:hypothetical protein